MTENRLLGADFARAAACLIVLFHHLAQRLSGGEILPALQVFRTFANNGTFGVAIFFVLSGFLLARPFWQALDKQQPMPSLRTYAMRRAARILPGFWLALTVTFVSTIAIFGVRLDGELLLRFLAGFLLVADWHWLTFFPVEVNGPLWSIGFEVTSYLLLPLGFALLFLSSGRIALAVASPLDRHHCAGTRRPLVARQLLPRQFGAPRPGSLAWWVAPKPGCRATTRSASSPCSRSAALRLDCKCAGQSTAA